MKSRSASDYKINKTKKFKTIKKTLIQNSKSLPIGLKT